MLITKDFHLINRNAINTGYARAEMLLLNIDRYYNEEEKQANKLYAETHSMEDWGKRCEMAGRNFCEQLTEIMEELSKDFVFAQYNTDVHAKDYDFFYCSNIGFDNRDWFDHVQLSINKTLPDSKKKDLFKKILGRLEEMDYKNLKCSIVYETVYDEEKMNSDSKARFEELKGKRVIYRDMEGSVRLVDKDKYGFFRKRFKTQYYPLCALSLLFDVQLSEEQMRKDIEAAIQKLPWQVECDTSVPYRAMTVQIGFSSDQCVSDETEFCINAWDIGELTDLFEVFCKENHFKIVTISSISVVRVSASFDELIEMEEKSCYL